jgi:hypothetical protein
MIYVIVSIYHNWLKVQLALKRAGKFPFTTVEIMLWQSLTPVGLFVVLGHIFVLFVIITSTRGGLQPF